MMSMHAMSSQCQGRSTGRVQVAGGAASSAMMMRGDGGAASREEIREVNGASLSTQSIADDGLLRVARRAARRRGLRREGARGQGPHGAGAGQGRLAHLRHVLRRRRRAQGLCSRGQGGRAAREPQGEPRRRRLRRHRRRDGHGQAAELPEPRRRQGREPPPRARVPHRPHRRVQRPVQALRARHAVPHGGGELPLVLRPRAYGVYRGAASRVARDSDRASRALLFSLARAENASAAGRTRRSTSRTRRTA